MLSAPRSERLTDTPFDSALMSPVDLLYYITDYSIYSFFLYKTYHIDHFLKNSSFYLITERMILSWQCVQKIFNFVF